MVNGHSLPLAFLCLWNKVLFCFVLFLSVSACNLSTILTVILYDPSLASQEAVKQTLISWGGKKPKQKPTFFQPVTSEKVWLY